MCIQKTIVIFANSVKHSAHCIAGKVLDKTEWVRPVRNKEGGELSREQINTNLNTPVNLLNIVTINFEKKVGLPNQPENFLVGQNSKFIFSETLDRGDIDKYLDKPSTLWIYEQSRSDRVSSKYIKNITQSLYLLKIDKIKIYWKDRSQYLQKPQRRGIFNYNGTVYDLSLTDPNYSTFEEQTLENQFVCISLGEEFNGYFYKIIASII